MANPIFRILVLLALVGCKTGAERPAPREKLQNQVTQLQQRLAPDRRTDRVEVDLERLVSDSLTGYTTVPEADDRLSELARQYGLHNAVRLLPEPRYTDTFGLVRTSVANLRTRPGHSEELTSQALLGTPLEIMDQEAGWYLVRTPDRYLAYLEEGAFVRLDRAGMQHWFSRGLLTCGPAQSLVRERPLPVGRVVSEVVAGGLLRQNGPRKGDYLPVRLPDGRTGWMLAKDLYPYEQLARPVATDSRQILRLATEQSGKPYLWGGTSVKAMDCSGLTKTAYYLSGYVIPRDASQQVQVGTEVSLTDGYAALQPGDLLFFGNLRDDGSERITHVGFYLNKGRFLHAGADNDYVTENSLLEEDVDFAPHRKASLLRARRLQVGDRGVVPVGEAFEALYTKSSRR